MTAADLLVRAKNIFLIRFVVDVLTRFGKNNGGLLAAGLAFFLVIAFVPLLLVGIAVLGFLIHRPDDALHRIQQLLTTQILPGRAGDEVMHLIKDANIEQTVMKIRATRSITGIVGILGLVWASIQIYINGSTAMNAAFETPENRNWFKLRLIALELLISTGVLLVLSIAATAYGSYISHALSYLPGQAVLTTIFTEVGAVLISTIMYAIIYKYLPAANVSWHSAFVGGFAGGLAWEIAKKGLATYLLHPNTSLYGNLANLIIFVLWVYYSMMILLMGAEVAANYSREVESAKSTKLKRVAHTTPAIDTATGKPPRNGARNRADRIRKTGQKEGISSRRG